MEEKKGELSIKKIKLGMIARLAVACLDKIKTRRVLVRERGRRREQRSQEWSILNEFIREKVAGWLN